MRERSGGDRGGAWRNRGDRGSVWRDQQSRDRVTVRDRQVIRRSRDRGTVDRGVIRRSGDTRFRGSVTYRDRGFDGRARWGGSWRGVPVRRDVTVIRDYRYGGSYRARRVYCAPRFYGQFVYVRPVRYFIAADAFIGGFGIRARILRPHYLYGCNFCDMRYETYALYHTHVAHCHHRPSGFTISVSNWDDDFDSYWDGPYHADDSYEDECDDCDDDEYYDDEYYE